jgi:hypothetical protein
MSQAVIRATDSTEQAKQALQAAIVDMFLDFFRVRFDETISEVGGTARAEYLRGRVNAAKDELQALKDLEKREREAERRRREIKRENDAHRKPPKRP